MGDVIEFDPIKIVVRDYLMGVQADPVVGKVPNPRPAKFTQLQTVGGTAGQVSQRPMLTFLCWDESEALAARYAERIRALMRACRVLGGLPVYGVREVSVPVYRPDPETQIDRYQFTHEIHVRGKILAPSP